MFRVEVTSDSVAMSSARAWSVGTESVVSVNVLQEACRWLGQKGERNRGH